MKKALLVVLGLSFLLLSCGGEKKGTGEAGNSEVKLETLTVAATPEPHGKILELAKPLLEKEGINLDVKIFEDYIIPNKVLTDKSVDANLFQHQPFLDDYNKKNGTEIVSVARSYTAPLGVYSKKYKSIDELEDKAEILIADDPTNLARSLILLDKNGIIKLKDANNVVSTLDDIVENPKNVKFTTMKADQLALRLPEISAAVIPGNFAVNNGLNVKESLLLEASDSLYGNVIAILKENESDPRIQKLIKVLQSDEMKKIVEEQYKGTVIPTF